ncbi:MAG: MBL fold metallo-hydrolase [Actinomycetota bacterium]
MRIVRLSWAGVKVSGSGGTALIDALGEVSPVEQYMGKPVKPLVPVAEPHSVDAALVTHLHPDHWDPATLTDCLVNDAPVLCPPSLVSDVEGASLRAVAMPVGKSTEVAGFTVEAVPAVGGLGEEQVSYVVSEEDHKILHCGDTLWHGYWWEIAAKGPFTMVFLPINGVMIGGSYATGIPAALTPQQAAAAASILKPGTVCPIHYGLFNFPPYYTEHPDAEQELLREAKDRDVSIVLMRDGESTELGEERGKGTVTQSLGDAPG